MYLNTFVSNVVLSLKIMNFENENPFVEWVYITSLFLIQVFKRVSLLLFFDFLKFIFIF
jgi:hypothetical protein